MTDFFPIVVTALAALVQGCLVLIVRPPIRWRLFAGLGNLRRHRDPWPQPGWLMVASLRRQLLRKDTTPGHSFRFSPAVVRLKILWRHLCARCSSWRVAQILCLDSRSWHSLAIPYEKTTSGAYPRLSTICDRSRSTLGLHGGRAQRRRPSSSHLCNGGRLEEKPLSSKSTGHIFIHLHDFSYRAHHWRLL